MTACQSENDNFDVKSISVLSKAKEWVVAQLLMSTWKSVNDDLVAGAVLLFKEELEKTSVHSFGCELGGSSMTV